MNTNPLTSTPAAPILPWKATNEAVPRTAVQMLCINVTGNILMIHRSDKVRSVRNTWSFPSGLHDVGETLIESCSRELEEEFGLVAPPDAFVQLGVYENINGDSEAAEAWHWVVNTFAVLVDFTTLVNREPDKHDIVEYAPLELFCYEVENKNFHRSFKEWYLQRAGSINMVLETLHKTGFGTNAPVDKLPGFCEDCGRGKNMEHSPSCPHYPTVG